MGHQFDALMETSDSDSSTSSSGSSSSSSSSSHGRATTPPTPVHVPKVERKFFNREQTIQFLSNLWNRRPDNQFILHVNCSRLNKADRTIWGTSEGYDVRGALRKHRAIFVAKLCTAECGAEVQAACKGFAVCLQQWFDDMVLYAKRQPSNKKAKKATALEVLHRVRCFWSIQAVRDLGNHPSMSRLFNLRGKPKESTLVHIQDS